LTCGLDVVVASMAKKVEGPSAQLGKDAGLATNATGIFGKCDVAHMVQGVLDKPMISDGIGRSRSPEMASADVPRRFAAHLPCGARCVEHLGSALHPDQAADARPFGAYVVGGHGPHGRGSRFDAVALSDLVMMVIVLSWTLFGQRHHGLQERGLVAFELNQYVIAAVHGDFQRFFDSAAHPA